MGHVMLPAYLRARGLVDRLLVAPVADHPLGKAMHPFAERLAWTRAAMADHEGVEVSELEQVLAADGVPNYTLRLLETVAAARPGWRVRLVVGSDIVDSGQTRAWRQWDDIVARFEPIVVPRAAPGQAGPLPAISSTQVRQWLQEGTAQAEQYLREALPPVVWTLVRPPTRGSIWIFGRGHLAAHAGPYVRRRGFEPVILSGRDAATTSESWPARPPEAVWIAVRDAGIEAVAQALRGRVPTGTVVVHGSGARRSEDVLGPLSADGLAVGTLHPAASLRGSWPDPRLLEQAAFGVEGTPAAMAWARALIGSAPVIDLQGLTAQQRLAYHAVCALVANHLAVSHGSAQGVWEQLGLAQDARDEGLRSLWSSALTNLLQLGIPEGVSGPAARGDRAGVMAHRRALPGDVGELYGSLSDRLMVLLGKDRTGEGLIS